MTDYEEEHVEVRYVEVPMIEWQEVVVPKVEIVEIEKHVPQVEVIEIPTYVDTVETHYVTREVEEVIEEEIIREVPCRQIVDVPVERIKEVAKVETVVREEVINIPGEVIQCPRTYTVENTVKVPKYRDRPVKHVVAQVLQPIIEQRLDGTEEYPIEAFDYDPFLCKVIIPVPKPVKSPLILTRKLNESHKYIQVSAQEYNGLVKGLNSHLQDDPYLIDLYVQDYQGRPIPPIGEKGVLLVPPKGPVSGTPQPPPTNMPKPQQSSVIAKTKEPHNSPKHPQSWLGRFDGAFVDNEALRYYRQHHQYFNSPQRRTTQKQLQA